MMELVELDVETKPQVQQENVVAFVDLILLDVKMQDGIGSKLACTTLLHAFLNNTTPSYYKELPSHSYGVRFHQQQTPSSKVVCHNYRWFRGS